MKISKKRKIKFALAMLFISSYCNLAYASCQEDVDEMNFQISESGSISSIDGYTFNHIEVPADHGDGTCGADGYFNGKLKFKSTNTSGLVCIISWAMGNWGNSLTCDWHKAK